MHYELYAIGGGALQLLGVITRLTKDIDIVGLVEGDRIVSARPLPSALRSAIVDSARLLDEHFEDLLRLEPSADELLAAARWTRTHDPSDGFRDQLVRALRDLGVPDAQV